jgi:hypothetical protein
MLSVEAPITFQLKVTGAPATTVESLTVKLLIAGG